ncbi:DJ-1/PfpI family protein [Tsukamurella strandjordii]|uniref:DJ-1/PfpI family protein n=1 Tax=Tsukamurella TaxID=2060 RepID=UPI001C7DD419|nr:DJ-1/PfpI family protein [Tsukamurella sp. TY48]GIZ96496.1 glutamine amidotransferase [Tsukamurella sp. TY48]
MRFGILVFDEVEVLDAFGPFEVLSVAKRLHAHRVEGEPIAICLVSAYPDRSQVVARGGLRFTADATIADAPEFDVLIVPGGVTTAVENDPATIAWISERASTPVIASVCTGAFLLAAAEILIDQTVTTHWEDQAGLAARYPRLTVVDGPRWVRAQNIYTSAGISAGLDLALHLVGLIAPDLPARVAKQMDYEWRGVP